MFVGAVWEIKAILCSEVKVGQLTRSEGSCISWKLSLQFSGRLVGIKVDNKNAFWFTQYSSTLLNTQLRENRVCLPRGSQLCMPNAQISVRSLFRTACTHCSCCFLFFSSPPFFIFFLLSLGPRFTKLFAGKISKEQFVSHFAIGGESIAHGCLPITKRLLRHLTCG